MSTLFKNFTIYTLGGVAARGISILTLPLITAYLVPSEYGELDFLLLLGSFFYIVLNLGMDSTLSYYYINHDELFMSKNQVASIIFLISLTWGFFLIGVLPSQVLFKIYPQFSLENIYLVCVIFFLEFFNRQFLNIFRLTRDSRKYITYDVVLSFLINGFTVILLVFSELQILAILFSRLISNGLVLLFLLLQSKKLLEKPPLKSSIILTILSFALPIFPQAFGTYLFTFTDRFLIEKNFSSEELGVYSATLKLTLIFVFFSSIFRLTILPDLLELLKLDAKIKLKKLYNTYFFFVHVIVSFSILLGPVVIFFLGDSYQSLSYLSGLMVVYPLYSAGFNIATLGFWKIKKNYIPTIILVISSVSNFYLTTYFISYFGLDGAIFSTAIISVFWIFATTYISNQYYNLHFSFAKQSVSCILFLAVIFFQTYLLKIKIDILISILIFFIYIFIEAKIKGIKLKKIS